MPFLTSMRLAILTALLVAALVPTVDAGLVRQPAPAPEWQASEWINGDPGDLADHRGKVVLIEFFQLWCPGCKSFSVPLFKRWHERYGTGGTPHAVIVDKSGRLRFRPLAVR